MVSDPRRKRAPVAPPPGPLSLRPTAGLFGGLSKEHVADILRSGVVRRFARGRIVVREGDPATHLFLIKRGSVDYHRVARNGRQVLLTRLFPPDTFGLGTFLDKPIAYIGTARTLQETELYSWEHRRLRKLTELYPKLAENALRIALEYIRLYSERHLALVSDTAEHRLARTLTQLGIRNGHTHPKGLEVRITNDDLASLADIGYFTASRLLNKWRQRGALEKSRGKVVIRCPEKMLAML